ncbi:MAG: hypothetical protein FI687_05380 [SAR202 cluster bacterium]|nr:hypothetical protein [SAR202 cluster bacterium]|tara:strand:- start:2051 stop:2461 length:411 start_codon:yes stop_codon:yes gene_type:complete
MKLIFNISYLLCFIVLFTSCSKKVDSADVVQSIPKINTESKEEALAKHLNEIGSVMYGAFWCPYCSQQKKIFGKNFIYIKYVECDPRGENSNFKLCEYKEIRKYPTWEIYGERFEGVLSLSELEEISNFKGSNFSY